ncbi:4Fe-4S binding protein [Nocardia sp. CNY236]|uniref:4Fe-4S binding protein n=1 Tax=Nocardia sp. CNY236 TaxID=1169152 RepID=UPI000424B1D1|nr:4Fe-4S binding protein [Nocardia sp. CNY236]
MPYVITQSCCNDASCVFACPVNCIHPTPDEPDFLNVEMLYVDPQTCVDCGACVTACPAEAITSSQRLTPEQKPFIEINADFYRQSRPRALLAPPVPTALIRAERTPLRVAIVGSGPSAIYAADELLTQPNVSVTVLDRLPIPYGMVRYGVPPDHLNTRRVSTLFDVISAQPGFGSYLNVDVGVHLSHAELLQHFHAVIYAVGAGSHRELGIAGEDLTGCVPAADFVAWYNGRPDYPQPTFDLSTRRAVVVGIGNVALDVARVLTGSPEDLVDTAIAPNALRALRESKVEEVVILARRGPLESAFTVPELVDLLGRDVDIVIEGDLPDSCEGLPIDQEHKLRLLHSVRARPVGQRKRIVFRYLAAPTEILGTDRVTGVEVGHTRLRTDPDGQVRAVRAEGIDRLETGLVLVSIGYRGVPIPGLPFDEPASVIPNQRGRVLWQPGGEPVVGTYVTGWIKRGPHGFIGTNKSCAQETVRQLATDFNMGRLPEPPGGTADFDRLVRRRQPAVRAGGSAAHGSRLRRLLPRA